MDSETPSPKSLGESLSFGFMSIFTVAGQLAIDRSFVSLAVAILDWSFIVPSPIVCSNVDIILALSASLHFIVFPFTLHD